MVQYYKMVRILHMFLGELAVLGGLEIVTLVLQEEVDSVETVQMECTVLLDLHF